MFDTGDPYTEGPQNLEIRIERDRYGNLIWTGGACTIHLRAISTTHAEVGHSECDATTPTGVRIHAVYENGVVDLDNYDIAIRYSGLIEPVDSPGSLTVACTYDGVRFD